MAERAIGVSHRRHVYDSPLHSHSRRRKRRARRVVGRTQRIPVNHVLCTSLVIGGRERAARRFWEQSSCMSREAAGYRIPSCSWANNLRPSPNNPTRSPRSAAVGCSLRSLRIQRSKPPVVDLNHVDDGLVSFPECGEIEETVVRHNVMQFICTKLVGKCTGGRLCSVPDKR